MKLETRTNTTSFARTVQKNLTIESKSFQKASDPNSWRYQNDNSEVQANKQYLQKVRCPGYGCVMILDEEDYTVRSQSDVCYNPFKNLKLEEMEIEIEYKCAYCESKNTKRVRKYGYLTTDCIRIFDFLYCIVTV